MEKRKVEKCCVWPDRGPAGFRGEKSPEDTTEGNFTQDMPYFTYFST